MQNIDRLCLGCMNDNGGEEICSICGWNAGNQNPSDKLPLKFCLYERYYIGKVLRQNGEGVTYLAWDNVENTAVNIKEYFPKGIALRNPDKTVAMEAGKEFLFNEGLIDFIEINRKLIGLEYPSLVATYSVFEQNGTVYAATAAASGITLQSFLERNGGYLKWEQARPLFLPLIDTVKGLHENGIIHGGISPESITVGRDGKLRLTSIYIPRLRFAKDQSAAELYSGYAACEQYGEEGLRVGAYTDVYGLSATLFRTLIGVAPPSADERMSNDTLSIPSHFADELPRQVLVAIANGIQVFPKNRTESIDIFKNELVYGETKENARRAEAEKRAEEKKLKAKNAQKNNSSLKYGVIAAACTAALFAVVGAILCLTVFRDDIFGTASVDSEASEIVSMPSIDQIGDYDSDAVESVMLYKVPDLLGKYYSQIDGNEEYERFKIVIKNKEYSTKHPRGTICSQSVKAGTEVADETEITVSISLGPKEVKVADVLGKTKQEAIIELLKQGFLYENIEIVDKYDTDSKPGVVLEQSPSYGESVNAEIVVRIYINSYEGEQIETSSNSANGLNSATE